jgi:hypothetical protein
VRKDIIEFFLGKLINILLLFCREWLDGIDSEKSKKLLRTQYHAVETTLANPLTVKW